MQKKKLAKMFVNGYKYIEKNQEKKKEDHYVLS